MASFFCLKAKGGGDTSVLMKSKRATHKTRPEGRRVINHQKKRTFESVVGESQVNVRARAAISEMPKSMMITHHAPKKTEVFFSSCRVRPVVCGFGLDQVSCTTIRISIMRLGEMKVVVARIYS